MFLNQCRLINHKEYFIASHRTSPDSVWWTLKFRIDKLCRISSEYYNKNKERSAQLIWPAIVVGREWVAICETYLVANCVISQYMHKNQSLKRDHIQPQSNSYVFVCFPNSLFWSAGNDLCCMITNTICLISLVLWKNAAQFCHIKYQSTNCLQRHRCCAHFKSSSVNCGPNRYG